jgi:phosphoribosylformimino-5-aminoimidazole carboxamide ribotide isomerase
VVVGTRAIEDAAWLARAARDFPGRLVVAADVRDANVVTHGWNENTQRGLVGVLAELNDFPIAAVLVTAVHKEGRMGGPDMTLIETGVQASVHPLYASGGIATLTDLRELAQRGVAGAVIGMALYTGALDPRAVADEFGGENTVKAEVLG